MQFVVWALGAIAAYRLWENQTWLAIVVAILALSYGVQPGENEEHEAKGMYSRGTGTRLMLTALGVAAIFVYSFVAAG